MNYLNYLWLVKIDGFTDKILEIYYRNELSSIFIGLIWFLAGTKKILKPNA